MKKLKLYVKEFCNDCPHFIPELGSIQRDGDDKIQTIVCKCHNRCDAIENYLDKKKEE